MEAEKKVLEEERIRMAKMKEEERRRIEAEKMRLEEERRRMEELKRKREEERKRMAMEEEERLRMLEKARRREEELKRMEAERYHKMIQSKQTVTRFMNNYNEIHEVIKMNDKAPKHRFNAPKRQLFQMWLKTKHLFKDCLDQNEDILSLCMTQIIENIFDGRQDLIQFIIDNASSEQLPKIYDIIKDVSLQTQHDKIYNEKQQKTPNYFKRLSEESVVNILSFLSRNDVDRFKCVCLEFSVIALEEMKKYSLYVLNTNSMITDSVKRNKFCNVFHDIRTDSFLFDRSRYLASKLMNNCVNEWFIKYNVPSEYAIILPNQRANKLDHNAHKRMDEIRCRKASYFLFDRRNIVKIDLNGANIVGKDAIDFEKKQKLIILHYYDVFTQCLNPVQILCISKDTKIGDIDNYILNHIKTPTSLHAKFYLSLKKEIDVQNMWRKEYQERKKRTLNDWNHFKFYKKAFYESRNAIFKEMKRDENIHKGYGPNNMDSELLIFQFDTNTPYFTNYRDKYKNDSIEKFYYDYMASIYFKIKLNFGEANALKSRLKAWKHIANDNLLENKVNDFEAGKVFLLQKDSNVKKIKYLIRDHLNIDHNNIQPKNIQLFDTKLVECIPSFYNISGIHAASRKSIGFMLVSYDATDIKYDDSDEKEIESQPIKYRIQIFTPKQCNLAMIKPTEIDNMLIIKYKKSFVYNEFMKHLIESIQLPLYANQFQNIAKILNTYCNNDDVYEINKRPKHDVSDVNYAEDIEVILQIGTNNNLYHIHRVINNNKDQISSIHTQRLCIESYLRSMNIRANKPKTTRRKKRIQYNEEDEYMRRNFPEMIDSSEDYSSSYSTDSSSDAYLLTMKQKLKQFDKIAATGQIFIKHDIGYHNNVIVKVSFDNRYKPIQISWGSGSQHIDFKDILYIAWGHYTKVFLLKKKHLHAKACFSIVSKDKVLDLQALDEECAELWKKGLRKLIGHSDDKSNKLAVSGMKSLQFNETEIKSDDDDRDEVNIFNMDPEELYSYYKYIVIKDDICMTNVFDDEEKYSAKRMLDVKVFINRKYLNTKTNENDIKIYVQFVVRRGRNHVLKKIGFRKCGWIKMDETVHDLFDTTALKQCTKLTVNTEVLDEAKKSTISIEPKLYKPKQNDILIITLSSKESDACQWLYFDHNVL